MTNLNLSLIIKAVDRISAPLARINRNVERSLGPIRSFNRSMTNLYRETGIPKVTEATRNLGGSIARVGSETAKLGVRMAALTGAAGFAFKRFFIDTAAEFEQFRTVLTTVEGSSEKAQRSMNWVSDFASKTPYELAQVTEAFVRLRTYGMDPTDGLLRTLGDTSAAMGKPLMQSVEAIADAVTGEYERLKEFGIKAETAGNKVRFAYTDAAGDQRYKIVEKNNRAMTQSTLAAIWNEKYGGAMESMSNTWSGMISNISDQWTRFAVKVMEAGVFDWLKEKLKGFLVYLDDLAASGRMDEIAKQVGIQLRDALTNLWEAAKGAWRGLKSIGQSLKWLHDLFGSWKPIVIGVAAVMAGPLVLSLIAAAGAVKALGVALLTTPVGWVIGAISAIAGAAYLIVKHWEPIKEFFTGLWSGVKETFAAALNWVSDKIQAALGWITEKIRALTGWMPDWVKKKLGIADAPAQGSSLGQPSPTLRGVGRNGGEVGGLIRIQVDSEGRPRVREVTRQAGNVDFDVDTGLVMAGP